MNDLSEFFGSETEEVKIKLRPELLLLPNIPKPLHGIAPRTIMGQSWWDEQRHKAYASLDYHCAACGALKGNESLLFRGWLEAHEVYDIDYNHRVARFIEIVPLCVCCHMAIHTGRLTSLYPKIYDEEDCWLVLERKKQVCGSYGVIDDRDYTVGWNDWRLEFEGKLYEPKFKTIEEWSKFYKGDE
jgi:hypothetical protein